jgi:hypothetical protein
VSLIDHIKQSEELARWLDRRIDGVEVPSDLRFRLAGGCLDMALEHHKAVILLVSRALYGSAFSIMRLMLEAYVRGVWLHQCGSDDDLKTFVEERFGRTFATLVNDVEKLESFSDGVLSAAKRQSWNIMCSFTHTGIRQVVRRNKDTTLEPDYDEVELLEALDFVNAIALMAAIQISHLAGAHRLASDLMDKATSIARGLPEDRGRAPSSGLTTLQLWG